MGLTAARGL